MELKSSDAAAVLVGMPEFVVKAAVEDGDEVWLLVETKATATGCPSCGVRAKAKDRRETKVRDLPAAGRLVVLVWFKRRWSCPEPDCETKTWTEDSHEIAPSGAHSSSSAGDVPPRGPGGPLRGRGGPRLRCERDAVMGAVREHGTPLVEDLDRTGEVEGSRHRRDSVAGGYAHPSHAVGHGTGGHSSWPAGGRHPRPRRRHLAPMAGRPRWRVAARCDHGVDRPS